MLTGEYFTPSARNWYPRRLAGKRPGSLGVTLLALFDPPITDNHSPRLFAEEEWLSSGLGRKSQLSAEVGGLIQNQMCSTTRLIATGNTRRRSKLDAHSE